MPPESPPTRSRAAAQSSAGSSRDYGRSTGAQQVQVRYYRRMKPNRTYPVVVSWNTGGRTASPVTVRLVMAGAQVVPAEQTLEPGADARATFFVTPIARGWLRGERLEVLQDGRKVQEISLPAKATTQRTTWLLLLLTLFVAWWIVPFLTEPVVEHEDQTWEQKLSDTPPVEIKGVRAIERRLDRSLPRVLPAIRKHLPDVAEKLEDVPAYVASSFYIINDYQRSQNIPIAESLLGLMILLTVGSWFVHLERRKRRVGKALPVGGGQEG